MRRTLAAMLLLVLFSVPASAQDSRILAYQFGLHSDSAKPFHRNAARQGYHVAKKRKAAVRASQSQKKPTEKTSPFPMQFHERVYRKVSEVAAQIVAHPAGCPRSLFCGCGVSVRAFGRPVRDLYLASNWKRFPPASPAPGMVAWRPGHVFYIEQNFGDGTVLAYDPNSGRRLTRIHRRSLAGYRVVNPHASRLASL